MNLPQIELRLAALLDHARDWLPAGQVAGMLELVHAGEPGIALEDLCTQLEEFHVAVPREAAGELRGLALAMGMEVPRWIAIATRSE